MKKFTLFLFAFVASITISTLSWGQITHITGSPTETVNVNTTTIQIAKPSGLFLGDVMFAQIIQTDNDGGTLSNATNVAGGWTVVAGQQFSSSGNNEYWVTLLYKVATVSDLSATDFTFTLDADANDNNSGAIVAFRGVHSSVFDVAAGTYNNANSDDLSATGLTTVTSNAGVLMFGVNADDETYSSWQTATGPLALTQVQDLISSSGLDRSMGIAWAVKSSAGGTGTGTAEISGSDNEDNSSILIALRPATAPASASLWASSSSGTQISSYLVSNGVYFSGPTNLFAPTFPGTTTGGTTTAAIGRNASPSQSLGHYYWLPNTSGNSGVVEVFAATSTGASHTLIGSIDVNGGSGNSLGFVRLGMGPDGTGWILAGDGTTLYLASFASNGVNPVTITIVDASVTLVGGAASTFQNGDICISGNNNIYALANDGSGVTQIFRGQPNGSSTTLTQVWDLVNPDNAAFTGSVNGVAFDLLGSLYITTSDGLYFIDQFTVNGPSGTVVCDLVHATTGLQDLASNVFPQQSTLPAKLLSFGGSFRNGSTTLNWEVEALQNFSHFEIERAVPGAGFVNIGSKMPTGDPMARATYQYMDDLSNVQGMAFNYRLKLVDSDGQFKYSNVILVRKETKQLTDLVMNPNPVRGGIATARFNANGNMTVDLKVIDMSGKVLLQQRNQVSEGTNSVNIENLSRLQPGTYILQMHDGKSTLNSKFIIAQ